MVGEGCGSGREWYTVRWTWQGSCFQTVPDWGPNQTDTRRRDELIFPIRQPPSVLRGIFSPALSHQSSVRLRDLGGGTEGDRGKPQGRKQSLQHKAVCAAPEMRRLGGSAVPTAGLAPGKRTTCSPPPVCTEQKAKGGPAWRETSEGNRKAHLHSDVWDARGQPPGERVWRLLSWRSLSQERGVHFDWRGVTARGLWCRGRSRMRKEAPEQGKRQVSSWMVTKRHPQRGRRRGSRWGRLAGSRAEGKLSLNTTDGGLGPGPFRGRSPSFWPPRHWSLMGEYIGNLGKSVEALAPAPLFNFLCFTFPFESTNHGNWFHFLRSTEHSDGARFHRMSECPNLLTACQGTGLNQHS